MSKRQDADKHFRETQRAYARGGAGANHHMFSQQVASTKKPGITGKVDNRGGPGRQFSKGGKDDTLGGQDAMPKLPGRTGNRRGIRADTRNYGK